MEETRTGYVMKFCADNRVSAASERVGERRKQHPKRRSG